MLTIKLFNTSKQTNKTEIFSLSSLESKSIYTAFWVMNYFAHYPFFHTVKMLQDSYYSIHEKCSDKLHWIIPLVQNFRAKTYHTKCTAMNHTHSFHIPLMSSSHELLLCGIGSRGCWSILQLTVIFLAYPHELHILSLSAYTTNSLSNPWLHVALWPCIGWKSIKINKIKRNNKSTQLK